MGKRILAIVFIYICTAAAWMILAGTILYRTEVHDGSLRKAVGQLWGTQHIQAQPRVYCSGSSDTIENLTLDGSDIKVDLKLNHRRKGLLWYSTYRVHFNGTYTIANPTDTAKRVTVDFPVPAEQAVYDNFRFVISGKEILEINLNGNKLIRQIELKPNSTEVFEIAYQANGLDEWRYHFGENVNQIRNFSLVMNTDFNKIDFPDKSISPTLKKQNQTGWELTWKFKNLLTGIQLGMVTPKKLNPGPWVSQVTAAAPVSLFLFFFLLFVCTTVRKIKLHPMNYFFLGAAFFSFHLLLAYLVDHISINLSFWICSAVSIGLVTSYMRLVVSSRFAFIDVAIFQLVYLVLFSYTFFFKGFTGLAITILCICTLFIVMQMTGKIDWEDVFLKSAKSKPRLPHNSPNNAS